MRTDTTSLPGESPGTQRSLTRHVWGEAGARPKIYLQAALHADEMPGVLVLQQLMDLLDAAEDRILGEVSVVPMANPIGFAQWISHKPQGRQDLESMQNFNRHYPDLAVLAGDRIESRLGPDEAANRDIIRAAFAEVLDELDIHSDLDAQRQALLRWSHDADFVLDCHCDHFAVLHFYASTVRPDISSLLARCIGADLALIQEISGGNAFDEAHTAPWAALKRRFGDRFPIPLPCFSTTLEYRGQFDVADDLAVQDAANLMTFLEAIGAVRGPGQPAHADCPHLPLAGAAEGFAPQGGVVSWLRKAGDTVTQGEAIAHVINPITRQSLPVAAPASGLLFRTELWPSVLGGQSLCHVAGAQIVRSGNLLSD